MNNGGGTIFSNRTLQQDCIDLAGVKVPFLVSNGRVFLDMLASFTVLGQLRLPLKNEWEAIDRVLMEQGLTQKDAFRWRHTIKVTDEKRKTKTQQSHITFKVKKSNQ